MTKRRHIPKAHGPAAGAAATPPRSRRAPPAPPADVPAPPLVRDGWAWACALAVLPLVVHALGAPLGEPVAEDFDFLHYALFSRFSLLDGGGSEAFWRPLPHQIYYKALAPLILDHPGVIAALHAALLALATVLIYRAFRRGWPPAWAALIATFPLLSESTRTVIAWPSHFVEIGLWLFTAIAIHEAAARRLWSTLAALLAALLCKEVAVVTAALVPWIPGIGPRERRGRLRWTAATGAVTVAWAASYWVIRKRAGLHMPHDLEGAATGGTPFLARIGWAAGNSLRALFSLPAVSSDWAGPVAAVVTALVAIGLALTIARRHSMRAEAPALALWGLAWFLASSTTMATIFPLWAPNRSLYGSLGVGALAAAFLGTAHDWLPGVLVVLRLAAFAVSPGPPRMISARAPQNGAFLDFERLVRLQLLMRETRTTLAKAHPTLLKGAGVGLYNLPYDARYAFGDERSLQAWYRDSTLHWVHQAEIVQNHDAPMVTIVEFEEDSRPQITLVSAEAMRLLFHVNECISRRQTAEALADLARADSLEHDPASRMFAAQVAGIRATALALAPRGPLDEAEREAHRGIALWPLNIYAHQALGIVEYRRGHLREAEAEAESVLSIVPTHQGAKGLLDAIATARSAGGAQR